MLPIMVEEAQAPEEARYLLARAQQEVVLQRHGIIEMITTIMVYKFGQLSRLEVEAMLGIRLEETRVYQEARAEGEQIGEQRGEQRGELRGEQRGRQDEALSLVLRLLTRQLKQELPEAARSQIITLPLPQLEALGEALLDFQQLSDLQAWLQHNQP
jgi:predicted transposase YdaD